MRPLQLSDIARMTGGRLHGMDRQVDAIATDTRTLPATGASLFVALKGENFDGHDHAEAAAAGGVTSAGTAVAATTAGRRASRQLAHGVALCDATLGGPDDTERNGACMPLQTTRDETWLATISRFGSVGLRREPAIDRVARTARR